MRDGEYGIPGIRGNLESLSYGFAWGVCEFESRPFRQLERERFGSPSAKVRQPVLGANMTKKDISGGVVHKVPTALREALTSDSKALAVWESLTPLSRNEWICWTISVKTPEKRKEHVGRVVSELKEGMRRPCCWYGCVHRKDKALSPSQKFVLSRRARK